ncbi:MAG TPA: PaaI family thioesterase [Polyangiaceae bacterium]|nr:PaaI family thioesterase [Polyangiaceae bacterium]
MTRTRQDGSGNQDGEKPPLDPLVLAQIAEAIASHVPHNQALGIRFVSAEERCVTLALPYDEKLVGNPLTRVIHGGAITTLLDGTCGTAVFLALREPIPIATLDLRIDYLRPATPEKEVHARAECFRTTHNVAFVRCEAFHPGSGELVAVANGTFIIFRGKKLGHRGRGKS